MPESKLCFLRSDQMIAQGVRQLIQVNDTDEAFRINDHIHQQIRKDIGIRFFIPGPRDNIAVPADQLIIVIVEFTYLEAAIEKIAGKALLALALERLSEDKNSTSKEIRDTFITLKLRTSFY